MEYSNWLRKFKKTFTEKTGLPSYKGDTFWLESLYKRNYTAVEAVNLVIRFYDYPIQIKNDG